MNKKLHSLFSLGVALMGFSLFLCSSSGLMAQTTNYTWNNSGTAWSSSTAWTPSGGPQATSITGNTNLAIFGSVGVGNNSVTLDKNYAVYGLLFTNNANAYTFSGTSLDIMSTYGLTNNSSVTQTFNNTVQQSSSSGTWTTATGATCSRGPSSTR